MLLTGATLYAQQAHPVDKVAKTPTTAELHIDMGLQCESCHGDGKKGPVDSDKCLECHKSFAAVAVKTQDMKPNPHANHMVDSGELECTQCHHGHEQMTVICLRCHQNFTFHRHK